MRRSSRYSGSAALAIALMAAALSACGGGGDDDDGGNAGATGERGGIVSVRSVEGTGVLADSRGRTLYSADVEKDGRILCTSGCTSFWDPVEASSTEAKTAANDLELDLGVVRRPDGVRQLTLDRKPLYSFTQEEAGQLDGDGFVDDFDGTRFEWLAATTGAPAPSGGSGDSGATYPY
jgi:predicted lipoprotein with Yx(FWY)xxD motif